MKAAAFLVTRSDQTHAVVMDRQVATERASQAHGTTTPLFSAAEVIRTLDRMGYHAAAQEIEEAAHV